MHKITETKVLEQRGDYVIAIVQRPHTSIGVRMAGAREYLSFHDDVPSARGQIHNFQEADDRRQRRPGRSHKVRK
jgi:hypothetical protein